MFGWSRSAKRGTSAWAGSADISRAATPDVSSDEEGDYDTLGYLEVPGRIGRARSRSQQASYADLQKLRKSANSSSTSLPLRTGGEELRFTSTVPDNEGLHMRQGPRTRKASLNDGVPVERIGALDRQETFPEATYELNQEASQQEGQHLHED